MASDCGGQSREIAPRERDAGGGTAALEGGAAGETACAVCAGAAGMHGSGEAGASEAGKFGTAGEAATPGAAGEPSSGGDAGSAGAHGGAAGRETSEGGTSGDGAGIDGASGEGPQSDPAVTLASIRAYQAVEVELTSGDVAVATRNAPLIAGRSLMLRAFVTARPEIAARALAGKLSLVSAGTATHLDSRLTISESSTPANLDSTFVFQVEAGKVTTDLEWSFTLEEEDGTAIARYPAEGTAALEATDAAGALELTMVPMIANGFTPDLSPPALERYVQYALAAFPVPEVTANVREAVTLDFPVDSEGAGFSAALDRLYQVREADAPADNVYYYGVLTPSATFEEYCALGCTVGLASVANPNNVYYRGGIGTGYFVDARDTNSQETLVHELGHAMGRGHSPCGTDDAWSFPYPDGSIGVWGYDGAALRNPRRFSDVMGYCLPVWVSDYTYAGLFERIAHVNATASARRVGDVESHRHRRLILDHDGALRWGSETAAAPSDAVTRLEITLTTPGSPDTETVLVPFAPFDHLPGGFALVPAELLVPGVRFAVGDAAIDAP